MGGYHLLYLLYTNYQPNEQKDIHTYIHTYIHMLLLLHVCFHVYLYLHIYIYTDRQIDTVVCIGSVLLSGLSGPPAGSKSWAWSRNFCRLSGSRASGGGFCKKNRAMHSKVPRVPKASTSSNPLPPPRARSSSRAFGQPLKDLGPVLVCARV